MEFKIAPHALRVALIGCGAISVTHIAAIKNTKQTLCALCDIDLSHAKALMEKHELSGIPIYTDYEEMMDAQHPDVVHICTPHYLHAPMCIAAMKRNIHVLCEKPLAISIEQLQALHEAKQTSASQVGVCHQNRYEPNCRRMYDLAHGNVVASAGFVLWERNADYYHSGEWRGKWETEGGGVMINQALHTLDLMQWIGGMPTHLTARISNDHLKGVIEVEDTASARFEVADESVSHFYATTAANKNFPIDLWFRLQSGDLVTGGSSHLMVNGQILPAPERGEGVGKTEWGVGHVGLITDFYHCLLTGEKFSIDIDEAEKVVRLILGMYTSNGERIPVPTP